MESLLTPQVCMDIEETPLDVGNDDTSSNGSLELNEPEVGDDEKVRLLLEENFVDSAQVPEELTDFEKEAKRNVFAVGEPAVQFQRLHCTACNIHLGSAPIGHFNRHIHPLLKVLLCKACYDFYCSGEFDKDEDGSEMYCRWCGQGGKVMCCAQCAYVFCQKCVRQNLGKRTLELIKDSDDWLCFGCNPTQLINLKIVCTSLYEFVREEIRLSKSLNNLERLKIDHSVCCQKVKAAKRKRDEDVPYTPYKREWEEMKSRKSAILKGNSSKTLQFGNQPKPCWNTKEEAEAEVVCTPDLLTLMETTPAPNTIDLHKFSPLKSDINLQASNTISSRDTCVSIPNKIIRSNNKKLYTIAPKPMIICNANSYQKNAIVPGNVKSPTVKLVSTFNRLVPVVNSIPAHILPGTKHDWYDKAAVVVSSITTNLSVTLSNLNKEQKNAKSVEQLANIHNKLQELLSSSVNSLIQVRKNLRTEFLDDLNKLKFSNLYSCRNNNKPTAKFIKTYGKGNTESADDAVNEDDVIVIPSENSSMQSLSQPPPLVKISSLNDMPTSRPYLKVRSVSQLLSVSSECITIPDDPSGSSNVDQDVIAIEDDPLESSESQYAFTNTVNEKRSIVKKFTSKEAADIINQNNALTQKRIEQLAEKYIELQISDISKEELKRILSIRVLIATDFGEALPSNRLKGSIQLHERSDANAGCNNQSRLGVVDSHTTVCESQYVNVSTETNEENYLDDDGACNANTNIKDALSKYDKNAHDTEDDIALAIYKNVENTTFNESDELNSAVANTQLPGCITTASISSNIECPDDTTSNIAFNIEQSDGDTTASVPSNTEHLEGDATASSPSVLLPTTQQSDCASEVSSAEECTMSIENGTELTK